MSQSVVTVENAKKYLGFMACYILMLGIFCYTKQGDITGFGKAFLPMSFIMLYFYVAATLLKSSNMHYTMLMIALIGLGTVMQVLVGDRSPYNFMTGRMLSLAFASVLVFLCILSQKAPVMFQILLYVLAFVLLVILSLKLGLTINGSRAWIGQKDPATDSVIWSIQLTEFLKVICMLILSGIFAGESLSGRKKMNYSFVSLLCFTLVIGIYMKEFGTVFVLFLVWIIAVYIILGEKYLLKAAAGIAGMTASIIGMSFGCSILAMKMEEKTIPVWEPVIKTSAIWGKFTGRMDLFLHLDSMEPDKAPYQLVLSRKALRLAGLFGNSRAFYDIPVQSSDMVMSMIILRMGLVLAILIMAIFLLSYRESFRIAETNSKDIERHTVILFASFIVVQTLLSMFSSQGFFLLIGLPVCLFSSGKTQDMITLGMILYMIYASRSSVQQEVERS